MSFGKNPSHLPNQRSHFLLCGKKDMKSSLLVVSYAMTMMAITTFSLCTRGVRGFQGLFLKRKRRSLSSLVSFVTPSNQDSVSSTSRDEDATVGDPYNNSNNQHLRSLLRSTVQRAQSTIFYNIENGSIQTDVTDEIEEGDFESSSPSPPSSSLVKNLFKSATKRAQTTLGTISSSEATEDQGAVRQSIQNCNNHDMDDEGNLSNDKFGAQFRSDQSRTDDVSNDRLQNMTKSLLKSVINHANSTLKMEVQQQEQERPVYKNETSPAENLSKSATAGTSGTTPSTVEFTTIPYNENPAITNTALAQSLWSTIVRPNVDTVIDATCGNGYDSVTLAELLFRRNVTKNEYEYEHDDKDVDIDSCTGRLICIDIQKDACDNTTAALYNEGFGPWLVKDHIQVIHGSHAPLPRHLLHDKDVTGTESTVALVVYNLGYLPNSEKESRIDSSTVTSTQSTLASLVDAVLLVRIGGMVSVVTYPRSNKEEDVAVRTFLECMALLTSKVQTWREFVQSVSDIEDHVREWIISSMESVTEHGFVKQTWRVSEHRKVGMDRAPILVTAVRIK